MQYPRHRPFLPPAPVRYAIPKTRRRIHRDGFHLPTVLAENDPFLRNLYGVVSYYLDDHPYPTTQEDFEVRESEIQRNVDKLKLSTGQSNFLDRLMTETGVNLVDLWQGSHVIARDRGYLYDVWSKMSIAKPRFSSHYRNLPVQQYGINFTDHQLLFGKTPKGLTWFQMEAHGFEPNEILNNPNLFVSHGQDFLKYRLHHMNVGPFGFSPHTEMSDPIIVQYQPISIQQPIQRQPSYRQRLTGLMRRHRPFTNDVPPEVANSKRYYRY